MVILYPYIVYKSSLGLRWINKHIWVKETEKQKSQNKYSNRGVSCYYNDIMLVYLWILFFPSNTGTHLISLTVFFFVQNKRRRNNHYIIKQFKANPCNNDKQIRLGNECENALNWFLWHMVAQHHLNRLYVGLSFNLSCIC